MFGYTLESEFVGELMGRGFALGFVVVGVLMWQGVSQTAVSKPVRMIRHQPLGDISQERREAFGALNRVRSALGMVSLQESRTLMKAAQAHADYLALHRISSHFERRGTRGFYGIKPVDRAVRAGYGARWVGENLSTGSRSARSSVEGLFSAIYHRFGFLNPAFDEIGIGIARDRSDPSKGAFVYVLGNRELDRACRQNAFDGRGRYVRGACADTTRKIAERAYTRARQEIKQRNPKIIRYPYDGQTEVPPAFYDERPDPLPTYAVSGFPVTLEFNDRFFRTVEMIAFDLYEAKSGRTVACRLLDRAHDPNGMLTRGQFALMPLKRLKYDTRYRVRALYRHHGKTHRLTWHFRTRRPKEPLIVIRKKDAVVRLERGKRYWLYFAPLHRKDILGKMRFPSDLSVRFIDQNTMQIALDRYRTAPFAITGEHRRVRIEIR
jgi:uncharacterized protein YkwD